jgi:hypothetical protein
MVGMPAPDFARTSFKPSSAGQGLHRDLRAHVDEFERARRQGRGQGSAPEWEEALENWSNLL